MTITQLPTEVGGTITNTELRDRLGDPALVVVDVRPLAAYNGWRLRGEARGGHIPGAVAFPIAWLATVDAAEIERLLAEKGVAAGRDDRRLRRRRRTTRPRSRDRLVGPASTTCARSRAAGRRGRPIPSLPLEQPPAATRSSSTSPGCGPCSQGRRPEAAPARHGTCCST